MLSSYPKDFLFVGSEKPSCQEAELSTKMSPSPLSSLGLPTESSITAMYGHNDAYQRVTADLQGGNRKISVIFGVEKLHPKAIQTQLANHSLEVPDFFSKFGQ